jgi:hypothetical protein
MIVSTTLVSAVELVLVSDCDGGGGGVGATASLVGIWPARAVTDITPVRATANRTDFMFGVSFD